MKTRFANVRDLHSLCIGDTVEVSEGRRAGWRPVVVTDRQSAGAPIHIPFHVDVEFNDDEGGPYEVITISAKELHPKGRFRIRRLRQEGSAIRAKEGPMKEHRKCPRCPMNYLYAVRVSPDGAITFRKLGTSRNRYVVATWCERCGRVDVEGKRFEPRARVAEDGAS